MYHKIVHDQVIPFYDCLISDSAKDLVRKLLDKRPAERLGYQDIEQIEKHPFFNGIDWTRAERKQLDPPIIPNLNYDMGVPSFDRQFIHMSTTLSPPDISVLKKANFSGFSFAVK